MAAVYHKNNEEFVDIPIGPNGSEESSNNNKDQSDKNETSTNCLQSLCKFKKKRIHQNKFHYYRFVILLLAAYSNALLVLVVNIGVVYQNMVNSTAIAIEYGEGNTTNHEEAITTPLPDFHLAKSSNMFNNETEFIPSTSPAPDHQQQNSIKDGPFVWSPIVKQLISNSFNLPFSVIQIFGGPWIERLGNFKASLLGQFISGMSAVLIPLFAYIGWPFVVVLRALLGFGLGLVYPAAYSTVENWSLPSEKVIGITIIQIGSGLGNTLSPSLSGKLCDLDFLGGWPLVFYLDFVLVAIWIVLWFIFVSDTPETHQCISEKELEVFKDARELENKQAENKNTLEESSKDLCLVRQVGVVGEPSEQTLDGVKKDIDADSEPSVVYSQVFKSRPMLAAIYIYSIYCTTNTLLIFMVPEYCIKKLMMNNSQSGTANSLMMLTITFSYLICGFLDTYMTKMGMQKKSIRRILFGSGSFITGTLIAIAAFVPTDHVYTAVSLLIACRLFHGFVETQLCSSVFDMCPTASGTMMGFVNGVSAVSTFILNLLAGLLLQLGHDTLGSWRLMFMLCAVGLWSTTLVYMLFIKPYQVLPAINGCDETNKLDMSKVSKVAKDV